ncbi:hypothetical protein [Streptomyces sp. NPDC008092]|uniref:hypothetical protein n=1 Tax=Streptomyces sp. NPDC008092 TaxID=3364808 RepID=UPI0036F01BE5
MVKLLIALDHLWDRGPGYGLPSDDRARLDSMLRSSDDSAADFYWTQDGGSAIIGRMIPRLGLTDTAGPPADYPGHWGYTALSAADTVRIYRWILDSAPAALRDIVMGDLRASTRCGVDGFDQRFGVPASFQQPWAVKQGWSGFGESSDCTDTTAPAAGRRGTTAPGAAVDLARPALHTTGTVGAGDRSIVAVFTLHPQGTPFGAAYSALLSPPVRRLHHQHLRQLPGQQTARRPRLLRSRPGTSSAIQPEPAHDGPGPARGRAATDIAVTGQGRHVGFIVSTRAAGPSRWRSPCPS